MLQGWLALPKVKFQQMFLYSFIQKPSKDNFLYFLRAFIDQTLDKMYYT